MYVALGAGVVVLGLLAANWRVDGPATPLWRLARVPWEVVPLGSALAMYLAIRDGSAVRIGIDGVVTVSPLLVLFPLLALVGG